MDTVLYTNIHMYNNVYSYYIHGIKHLVLAYRLNVLVYLKMSIVNGSLKASYCKLLESILHNGIGIFK